MAPVNCSSAGRDERGRVHAFDVPTPIGVERRARCANASAEACPVNTPDGVSISDDDLCPQCFDTITMYAVFVRDSGEGTSEDPGPTGSAER